MTVKISKPAINVREELADLRKPTGVAGEAMLRAETPQEQQALIGVGQRNALINGCFRVSQRASYTTATTISNGDYHLDRWIAQGTGTIQDLGGSIKLVATSSYTGNLRVFQNIEDKNYQHLLGKELTISAEVRSNTPNARLALYDLSDTTRTNETTGKHSGSGAWEKLTLTLPFDASTSFPNVQVSIDGINGADVSVVVGDYIEIKNVQLELGKVATPFEHRTYGEELALCQRYFTQWAGQANLPVGTGTVITSTTSFVDVQFPVEMRASPTVSQSSTYIYEPAASNVTSFGTVYYNTRSLGLNITTSSGGLTTGRAAMWLLSTSSSYVRADAEL